MKKMYIFILSGFLAILGITSAYASDKYPTKIIITKLANDTPYDLPGVSLRARESRNTIVFNFPSDRPWATTMTSQVFENGKQQNCLLNLGINNFDNPNYVGGKFYGCDVETVVTLVSETEFSVTLRKK